MVLNYNAFNRNGAAQTGKGEVIHLYLAHHVEATGVNLRRDQLVSEGLLPSATLSATNSVEIQGVTYTANSDYDRALAAQTNLDNIIAAFNEFAQPVYVNVAGPVATAASLTADSATPFIAGADVFGTELIQANGLGWTLELVFEQKGMFVTGNKGDVTVGTGDNYGSAVADIHALLEGTVVYLTDTLANGGDSENMVDIDTSAAFADGINVTTGVSGAFAGAQGDAGIIVSAGNAAQATSQSVLIDIQVAPNLQS